MSSVSNQSVPYPSSADCKVDSKPVTKAGAKPKLKLTPAQKFDMLQRKAIDCVVNGVAKILIKESEDHLLRENQIVKQPVAEKIITIKVRNKENGEIIALELRPQYLLDTYVGKDLEKEIDALQGKSREVFAHVVCESGKKMSSTTKGYMHLRELAACENLPLDKVCQSKIFLALAVQATKEVMKRV
ncbi:MAG: hypothetical protein JWO53_497 [Chlamydiia bacterium]|nr:hypothetical protein [Chlamydiia bacterium]